MKKVISIFLVFSLALAFVPHVVVFAGKTNNNDNVPESIVSHVIKFQAYPDVMGSITATVDGNPISYGDSIVTGKVVEFTAHPSVGWKVSSWWVSEESEPENTTNTLTLLLTEDMRNIVTVIVSFEQYMDSRQINFYAENGYGYVTAMVDGVAISNSDRVTVDKNVVFTATPLSGYRLKHWRIGNEIIPDFTENNYVVSDLSSYDQYVSITAVFEKIPYPVTFSVIGDNGLITASTRGIRQDISSGDYVTNVDFRASPDSGYRIKEWRLNDSIVSDSDKNTDDYYFIAINRLCIDDLKSPVNITVEFEPVAVIEPQNEDDSPLLQISIPDIRKNDSIVEFSTPNDITWSLMTLDDRIIDQNTYKGKTIVMVLFRGNGTCGLSNRTVESLGKSEWIKNDDVVVIAVCEESSISKKDMSEFKDKYTPNCDDIVYAYNTSTSNHLMYRYIKKIYYTESNSVSATYTIPIIIDSDNNIRYLWQGNGEAEKIQFYLSKIVPSIPYPYGSVSGYEISDSPAPRTTLFEVIQSNYTFPRWASPITSYLVQNEDESITSVELNKNAVKIETADIHGTYSLDNEISFSLPIYGGFFSGEKYNYIAFGENNEEQDDNMTVIRIVKYDKSFNRLDSVAIKGGMINTRIPFKSGSARMAEVGDTLVLHTARERYTSEDGLNHQSNLTIIINTETMNVLSVSNLYPDNHVSHSFDQYVLIDGNTPVYLDHGDAYPREVVLQKGGATYSKASMFKIPGAVGANATGVTIGGFSMSAQNYLAIITTVDHTKVSAYTNYRLEGLDLDQRDIVVCTLPKDFTYGAVARQTIIGKYIGSKFIASTPKLLSNGDNTFTVIWQEFSLDGQPGEFVSQVIDANGDPVGSVRQWSNVSTFYNDFMGVTGLNPSLVSASEWARKDIAEAIEKGLVPSSLQDKYTDIVTRAEFCALATALFEKLTGETIVKRVTFVDTKDVNVEKMAAIGVVSGVGDSKFAPDAGLTREQAAVILSRLATVIGKPLPVKTAVFDDNHIISPWAIEFVGYVQAGNIMSGTGNNMFSPQDSYTREQGIITILKLYNASK